MTTTADSARGIHMPEPEDAHCCALGKISAQHFHNARTSPKEEARALAPTHIMTWLDHFLQTHPDRQLEPTPGCAECLEFGMGRPERLTDVQWEHLIREHRAGHLLLPTVLLAAVPPAA
ncbi:hypothetical protein AB0A05_26995 [Streptomyces sp. NPDC046374]|uniref:hypothetical protein n=1 Tax=Streptomyces sp. NPDC046374 TaxID=3154917 RepID=UPI0033D907B6